MNSKAARVIPFQKDESVHISMRDTNEVAHTSKSEDELLLQSINQNINEAIYRSIRGKGLVYINDAFVKMFGYEDEYEILNENALNLYSSSDERDKLAKEIIKHGSVTNKEVEFKRKDGTIFIASFSSTMVIGSDGITYFDGAIRDISESKKAEEQLKYQSDMQKMLISISSKYLNLPLDSIDEGINMTLGELGNFLKVDRLQMHNYDLVKNECSTIYEWCDKGISPTNKSHKTPLDAIMDMVRCHFKGENFFIKDVSLLDKGLAKQALEAQKIKSVLTVPMLLENNCVGFISLDSVKSIRSYTDSEITMIQLFANMSVNIMSRSSDQKQLHKLLETSIIQKKRIKDFSQITSHNIRTSVANLVAINHLLQDDSENKEYLNYLNITIDKLNKSIYNINHLLNLDNKNELLEKKTCNITSSINRVLKQNNQSIKEKEIVVINTLPNKLRIKAFPTYLDGIFQHLISNALKHGTDKKSKKIKIDYSVNSQKVAVKITDYGKGIDLDRHGKKIFQAGVQFHSDNCKGQGMGLFMSNYMIEVLGGEIKVKSKIDKGTTFTAIFKNV